MLRDSRHARPSIARSTAFRLAAYYVLVFLASFLVAGTFAYNMIAAYLSDRLDSQVTERYREIESSFAAGGIDGAIKMIGSHGPAIRGQETVYALIRSDGTMLAGNIAPPAAPHGFSTLAARNEVSPGYRLLRRKLGDFDLLVGISYGDTERLRKVALVSFGWTAAVVLAAGLGSGAFLAFRARRRIALLSQKARAIGAGALATRLPVSHRQDDIDMLAAGINVALDQLEATVGAMRHVTTDIAHDLKTPVARLYLTLEEALENVGDDTDSAAKLREALRNVDLITRTFEALLRISQIEAGARRGKFTRIDLAVLVDELHDIYAPIVEDSGRSLRLADFDRHGELPIAGDAELLRQMCVNILDNAIRHTRPGAMIAIACRSHGQRITLTISDNGPGIPAAERGKVFKRFYRLERSRTTEGSGLGLSLVKAIADLHAAEIQLDDNRPGLVVGISFALSGNA